MLRRGATSVRANTFRLSAIFSYPEAVSGWLPAILAACAELLHDE